MYEKEKDERCKKETEMLKKLMDEAANLAKLIEDHRNERIARIAEVREECKDQTRLQDDYLQKIQTEDNEGLERLRITVTDEMLGRFEHQTEVINDMQEVIKGFQGTLKVFGKNS